MFKDLLDKILSKKNPMVISAACLSLVKKFEGLSLKPYICPAGVATIGYGNTEYENGTKVAMTDKPISEARANEILTHFLNKFAADIQKLIKVSLTQGQLDGLTAFAYNVGVGNFKSSTLLKKLNAGDYAGAAEQFLRWDKAGGVVLPGLVKRRHAEKELFEGK